MNENNRIYQKYLKMLQTEDALDAIEEMNQAYAAREYIMEMEMAELKEFAAYLYNEVLNKEDVYPRMTERWGGEPYVVTLCGLSVTPEKKAPPRRKRRMVTTEEVRRKHDILIDEEILENALRLTEEVWMVKGAEKITAAFGAAGAYSFSLPEEEKHFTFHLMRKALLSFLYVFIEEGGLLTLENGKGDRLRVYRANGRNWTEDPFV